MTNAFTTNGLFGNMFRDPAVAASFSAERVLQHAVAFERAWTETLLSLGAVTQTSATRALAAIEAYEPNVGAIGASSDVNGLPVPGFVKELRAGLSETDAAAIHTGTTSQDVIDTAVALILLDVLDDFSQRLDRIISALCALVEASEGTMMGRTRMQAALPIPVAARVQSWLTPLRDCAERLDGLRAHVGLVQLGGPVGLRDVPEGQGEAAAMELARRLGLRVGPVWHANRSPVLDMGHWLTLVSGALGKMGQDVALMAQQGVSEVVLRGGGSSSAMPHKQNPILAETLVTLAQFVAVQQGGLGQAMVHEQERSGAAWALEWMILPAMAEATGVSLRHAEALIGQIERVGPE